MNKYLRVLAMGIKDRKAFRSNYYLGFISIPIQILIVYYFWKYANINNDLAVFSLNSITLYFIAINLLELSYIPAMYICYEVWESINNGGFITWLARPVDYIALKFFEKFGVFILNLIPSIIIYNLIAIVMFKIEFIILVYGLLSSILGFILLFLLQMLLGLCSFWLKKTLTLRDLVFEIFELLGGSMIPVDYFPNIIKTVSIYSPFAYIYYAPAKILSGVQTDNSKILLLQIFWIAILTIICKVILKLGMHKVSQGG
ncbi:MAG: ABC-2 family transporter protein [Ezakiella sp.]|nr:ABC-2 family transporter protein [Ezakiella sp.]